MLHILCGYIWSQFSEMRKNWTRFKIHRPLRASSRPTLSPEGMIFLKNRLKLQNANSFELSITNERQSKKYFKTKMVHTVKNTIFFTTICIVYRRIGNSRWRYLVHAHLPAVNRCVAVDDLIRYDPELDCRPVLI